MTSRWFLSVGGLAQLLLLLLASSRHPFQVAGSAGGDGRAADRWRRCVVNGGFTNGTWTHRPDEALPLHPPTLHAFANCSTHKGKWFWTPIDPLCALELDLTAGSFCAAAGRAGIRNIRVVGDSLTRGLVQALLDFV